MKEIWKYIKGFNHKYLVSNLGHIYCNSYIDKIHDYGFLIYKGIPSHKLNPSNLGDGYLCVSLSHNYSHKQKTYKVHRLVAKAFIPNPHHYPFVNHKDENGCNNKASNLEWCTPKYNSNYGTCTLRSFLTDSYYATEHLDTHLLSKHDIEIFYKIHEILRNLHCINVK